MTSELQRLVPLTATGRDRLQEELDHLRREREPAALDQVRAVRADGGEDLELRLALDELSRVQQRILDLEDLLARAPIEDTPHTPGTITLGSRVTARNEDGRRHTCVLVSPLEAGATRGHVSAASPVGVALLGRPARVDRGGRGVEAPARQNLLVDRTSAAGTHAARPRR
jgi:transcription elongation factor GreA